VRPCQSSPQRGDNHFVAECLRKAQHVAKGFLVEAAPELRGQLSPQRGDNSFAILGTFELEDVTADTLADVPIKARSVRQGARRLGPRLARTTDRRAGTDGVCAFA
jgi:hypothetical protein